MVVVYGKPVCVQCTATTRELEKKEIQYQYVDLTQDPAAMEKVTNLGYKQAPVVMVGEEHWGGFRPDKIGALA